MPKLRNVTETFILTNLLGTLVAALLTYCEMRHAFIGVVNYSIILIHCDINEVDV